MTGRVQAISAPAKAADRGGRQVKRSCLNQDRLRAQKARLDCLFLGRTDPK
jgi:hypothetical protein